MRRKILLLSRYYRRFGYTPVVHNLLYDIYQAAPTHQIANICYSLAYQFSDKNHQTMYKLGIYKLTQLAKEL